MLDRLWSSGRLMSDEPARLFEHLDFLYTPSRDVAADMGYFADMLGSRIVFAIEAMGTRVAALEVAKDSPLVLLTDHLDGDRPILVYRVTNLAQTVAVLHSRGWPKQDTFEIPHGPCCSFRTPGGHRVAIYQLIRPEAAAHFEGRRDF